MTGRRVYFISHPDVVVSKDVPVTQWPLSATGIARMRRALAQPWVGTLSALYTSGETKAIDAVRILSAHCGLPWTAVPALGEIDRSATGFLPPPEFERVAGAFFAQPETSVRGWERAVDAQRRIVDAVGAIVRAHAGAGAIGILSHGAVGTLLHCALTGTRIDRRWDQPHPGGGCYLEFSIATPRACAWWRPVDEIAE